MDLDLYNIELLKNKFKNDSFVVVRNNYSKDVLKFFYEVFIELEKENNFQTSDSQVANSIIFNRTQIGYSVGLQLKSLISNIIEKELSTTYNYSRCYLNGSVLKKHKDRESCEYSITLCVKKGSCDYPIYFETKNGETVEIELEEGDLIIYEGTKLNHWRDKYQGDRHYQMFLHYVDNHGQKHLYKEDSLLKNISNYS